MAKIKICFVSQTGRNENPLLDPSVRYRCYHFAESLQQENYFCSVCSGNSFFESPNFYYDVYVFHRPLFNDNFRREVIEILKQKNKVLIADYDDLIFGDSQVASISSIVKNNNSTLEKAIEIFKNNLEALNFFDKVTVSTEILASYVRKYNPKAKVMVAQNFIPKSLIELHAVNKTHLKHRPNTTIGYFCGTKSHNLDFPIVEEILYRVLLENTDFSFLVIGPLTFSAALMKLPNVFIGTDVNYLKLPNIMCKCSKVIAPLEYSEFNQCKSRVKSLEAAISGCKLIATPIQDMLSNKYISFAETEDDWYELLSTVIEENDRLRVANNNFNDLVFLCNESVFNFKKIME